jgi:hypothetical protein
LLLLPGCLLATSACGSKSNDADHDSASRRRATGEPSDSSRFGTDEEKSSTASGAGVDRTQVEAIDAEDSSPTVAGDEVVAQDATLVDDNGPDMGDGDSASDAEIAMEEASANSGPSEEQTGVSNAVTPATSTPPTSQPSEPAEEYPEDPDEDNGVTDIAEEDAVVDDSEPADSACEPLSCESLNVDCGSAHDGCGGTIECGECPVSCEAGTSDSATHSPGVARSTGFVGQPYEYSSLYYEPCEVATDCVPPCTAVGGSEAMCAASECVDNADGARNCLPATAWLEVEAVTTWSGSMIGSADIYAEVDGFADRLVVEDFGFEVPDDARIDGIEVEVSRAASNADSVVDDEITLFFDEPIGEPRAYTDVPWPAAVSSVTYGGPLELWGAALTAEQVNSPSFGAAVSVRYLGEAGGARAYLDHVQITVYYSMGCD